MSQPVQIYDAHGRVLGQFIPTFDLSEWDKHPLQLRDASGKLLGSFVPALDLDQYESWEPNLDEAEIQLIEQGKKGKRYTTAEVLQHLERL